MSTRSAIVRTTSPSTFAGRYVHFDGYPTGVGQHLWNLYRGEFKGNLDHMLAALIDEHPAGWSSIDNFPEGCYCHDLSTDRGLTVTERNASRLSCEYVYAFEKIENGTPSMRILIKAANTRSRPRWVTHTGVALDGPEPDWDEIG